MESRELERRELNPVQISRQCVALHEYEPNRKSVEDSNPGTKFFCQELSGTLMRRAAFRSASGSLVLAAKLLGPSI
jgi:hypothetical protein